MLKPPSLPDADTSSRPVGDRWLNTKAAAAYLGLKPSSLSAMRINGLGPKYSAALKRDPRYRLSTLEAWMEDNIVSNSIQAKLKRRKTE